jgi:hypothetical protein
LFFARLFFINICVYFFGSTNKDTGNRAAMFSADANKKEVFREVCLLEYYLFDVRAFVVLSRES